MEPDENKNVHLIFDCDDTLINTHQLINHLMDSPEKKGIVSPTLLALCVELINKGQLASITINTHQDLETIQQRLNGMDGLLTRPPTETISWNVAQSLQDAIKRQTGKEIDVRVCLQSDIYPALATAENPDPAPHSIGYTAQLFQDHQEALATEKYRLQNAIGEMSYMRSGLGEGEKATQTAFVLAHIKKMQPNGVCHVLYFDDTRPNLEESNLPTRAWLISRIEKDRKILTELDPHDPNHVNKIRTLKNRIKILENALCVDDDSVIFEAHHFRHEEEQSKAGDPQKGTFNQIYHSRALDGKRQNLSVGEIIITCAPPVIPSNSPLNDSTHPFALEVEDSPGQAQVTFVLAHIQEQQLDKRDYVAFFDDISTQPATTPRSALSSSSHTFFSEVIDEKDVLRKKYFNETNGLFTQYLMSRARTYAWRDYWSTKAAIFLGFFGYETEQIKRQRFVTELEQAYETADSEKLNAMINHGKQEFSPRAPHGHKGFEQSLHHCLEQFELETLKKPQASRPTA